jgi:hypothetical protein
MYMFKVKMVSNHIGNLIKRFKELEKSNIQIGYFPENGTHESGLSYSGLYAIHAFGSTVANIPSRDPLVDTFSLWEPLDKSMLLKRQLSLYLSNIKSSTPKITVTKMLESIAGAYTQSARDVFGDSSKLAPNAQSTQYAKGLAGLKPDSPLLWTNSLRDNLSYSINGGSPITPA